MAKNLSSTSASFNKISYLISTYIFYFMVIFPYKTKLLLLLLTVTAHKVRNSEFQRLRAPAT